MGDRVIHHTLLQKNQATGEERVFSIYDEKYIEVNHRGLLGEKKFTLNLSILEPWPVRQRHIAWMWLLITSYFSIAALSYAVYIFQHDGSLNRLFPLLAFFSLIALGALIMFLSRSPHVLEFRSRYCGVPLLSLVYQNPDKETFTTFVDALKNRIITTCQNGKIDKHQMLVNEISRLERLVKEDVLNAHIYAQAKERIPNMRIY